MNITDVNDCLSELPEISILEFFRPRSPISGPFNWALCETAAVPTAIRNTEIKKLLVA